MSSLLPPQRSRFPRPPPLVQIALVVFGLGVLAVSIYLLGLVLVVATGGASADHDFAPQLLEAFVALVAGIATAGCCIGFATNSSLRAALLVAAVCALIVVVNAVLIESFFESDPTRPKSVRIPGDKKPRSLPGDTIP